MTKGSVEQKNSKLYELSNSFKICKAKFDRLKGEINKYKIITKNFNITQ